MEPPNRRRSLKRKQSSAADPFLGIFTRSKSQIYVHRSRSGRARPDASRKRNPLELSQAPGLIPKTRASNLQEASESDDLSQISIKDLRARRVFSPHLIHEGDDEGGIVNSELGVKCIAQSPNLSIIADEFSTLEADTRKSVEVLPLIGHALDETNPNLNLTVDLCLSDKSDVGESENTNENGGIEILLEECAQITPPMADENGENEGKSIINKSPNSSVLRNDDAVRVNDSVSLSKSVPNSCRSRKLFKTPSSFSYKRLLPFLMDIKRDESSVSKIELVDVDISCKVQKLNNVKVNLASPPANDSCAEKAENIGLISDDRKQSDNGETKNIDTQCPNKAQDLDYISKDQSKGDPAMLNIEQRNQNDNELPSRVDMMEDCIQTTPPDADIFIKPEADGSGANKEDNRFQLQPEECVMGKTSNGDISGKNECLAGISMQHFERENGSISKSKMVLNPCSRLKVIRTPSSVSYRRLLPFLMDIAKNNSSVSEVSKVPKIEKSFEEKPQPQIMPFSLVEDPKCKTDDSPQAHNFVDTNSSSSIVQLVPTDDQFSPIENGSSKTKEPNFKCPESIREAQTPFDSEIVPEIPRKVEENDLVQMSSPKACALEISQLDSVDSANDSTIEGIDLDKCYENQVKTVGSSQTEACDDPLGTHILTKGILKRNPRGCRGICSCLNCASFRLHAERAFEFSRNQMQEAEEVALELIEELASLRKMLEKPAKKSVVLPANEVREACARVLKKEELARKRLCEMNDDLNIHCKVRCLERPRVTFSRFIEDKK